MGLGDLSPQNSLQKLLWISSLAQLSQSPTLELLTIHFFYLFATKVMLAS